MESLADIFMGAVQYNEEGVLMSINELCGIMTNNSQEYQDGMEAYNRLVKLSQVWRTERAPSPPLHVDMWPPDVTAEPFSCMSAVPLRAKNKQCKHLWFLYAFTFMQLPQHLSTSFVSFLFCVFACVSALDRFTDSPVRSRVWTFPMRNQWRIWWTRQSMPAEEERDSGPTRHALNLASVQHKHTHTLVFIY